MHHSKTHWKELHPLLVLWHSHLIRSDSKVVCSSGKSASGDPACVNPF